MRKFFHDVPTKYFHAVALMQKGKKKNTKLHIVKNYIDEIYPFWGCGGAACATTTCKYFRETAQKKHKNCVLN